MRQRQIFSFGYPRSGTTFLDVMLRECCELPSVHIAEYHHLHPINSERGLSDLARMCGYVPGVVFVRIEREPLEVIASMWHKWDKNLGNCLAGYATPPASRPEAAVSRLVTQIRTERERSEAQRNRIMGYNEKWEVYDCRWVALSYEGFDGEATRGRQLADLNEAIDDGQGKAREEWVDANWRTGSVRSGRMDNDPGYQLPDDVADIAHRYIEEELSCTSV